MKNFYWRFIPLLLFFLIVLFLWRGLALNPQALPAVIIGKELPIFKLPLLNNEQKFFKSTSLRGGFSLLNIWASWCAACVEEQLFLVQLSQQQAIPIYGLNYKDTRKAAVHWLEEWGNPYRLVAADKEGKVAIDLGVYGTPETFLIDEQGIIRYKHVGIMDEKIWQKEFLPRIQEFQSKNK